jgi:Ca-activated chloride channel family protein
VSFANPAFLVGLALIPVLVALYVRAERRPHAFAPAPLMPSVAPVRAGWRRHAAVAGYGVALAALLVALAKPQASVAVPTEQARVMIVTDRSGSMLATDVAPNRLAAAKKAAGTFLREIPDRVRVGAIAFNQRAEVLQSPTRDHDAVREALQSVKAAGTTATGDAIKAALASIKGKAPAAIVLLSDGKSVRGSDPVAVARDAKKAKVPVYTVSLGTPQGTIPRHDRNGNVVGTTPVPPDPNTLARIAGVSGASTFDVRDEAKLSAVYKRLGSQIARKKQPRQITAGFAGGALALVVVGGLMSLFWFGRIP